MVCIILSNTAQYSYFVSYRVEADIIEDEMTTEEQKEIQKEEDAKNITEILMRPHLWV